MKVFIILCLACAVYAENLGLSAQQKEIVKKIAGECIKETGVNQELVSEFKKGNFQEHEGSNKFFYCFFKKVGIVDADGKLNTEAALSKLPPGADKDSATQALNACKDESGKDPADTAAKILRCYQGKTKQHILLNF